MYFHSSMQKYAYKNGTLESMYETSTFQTKIFISEVYRNMFLYINSGLTYELILLLYLLLIKLIRIIPFKNIQIIEISVKIFTEANARCII